MQGYSAQLSSLAPAGRGLDLKATTVLSSTAAMNVIRCDMYARRHRQRLNIVPAADHDHERMVVVDHLEEKAVLSALLFAALCSLFASLMP